MSFVGETLLPVPVDVAGGPYRIVRAVKVFDANSAAALETAINAWLTTLYTSDIEYFVLSIMPYSAANNKHSAVVSYGYFVPAP